MKWCLTLVVIAMLSIRTVSAGEIFWVSPIGMTVLAPGGVSGSLDNQGTVLVVSRVNQSGGSGTLVLPISPNFSFAAIDSVVIYFQSFHSLSGQNSTFGAVRLLEGTLPQEPTVRLNDGAFYNSNGGMQRVAIDVPDFVPQGTVTLSLEVSVHNAALRFGAFGLVLQPATSGVSDIAPQSPGSLAVAPNPFRSQSILEFQLYQAGGAEVRIFDPSGRLVRNLFSGSLSKGWHSMAWDGLTESGEPAASGMYFFEVLGNGQRDVRRAIRLR